MRAALSARMEVRIRIRITPVSSVAVILGLVPRIHTPGVEGVRPVLDRVYGS
jgi:hypothetical protein